MTPDQRDLLQALAYLYLRHGQNRRALTLILLAARDAPDDVGILRTLAYAFVENDAPEEALDVIERLEKQDFASNAVRARLLLKARALLHAGRRVEARSVFRQFVDMRRAAADTPNGMSSDDSSHGQAIVDAGDDDVMPSRSRPAQGHLLGATGASARVAGMK